MLIKKQQLAGIVDGKISLAFRRWKRPTVKAGGSLRTPLGVLAITSVDPISLSKITEREAAKAGFASRSKLLDELNQRPEGQLYRIALHYSGVDPRNDLRANDKLSKTEWAELTDRLARMDARSSRGPWTRATLGLIARNPGTRAPDLAAQFDMETKSFKADVRKLKELGLTESLKVGYRLSPRGTTLFRRLKL
jgi:hypothetical protein